MLYVSIATNVQRSFEQHCRRRSNFVKSRGVDHLVVWRLIGWGCRAET